MKQKKIGSLCGRTLRAPWLPLLLLLLLFTLLSLSHLTPLLFSASHDSLSSSAPSPAEEDPFFTTTSRGMRKCYPYHSSNSSEALGFLLIDSSHLLFNQTQQDSMRANFFHSIHRSGGNPLVRVLPSSASLELREKIILLRNFIQSHLASLPPVLLVSTALEGLLILSSPEKLEESFYLSKQRLLFSRDDPLALAIGYTEEILKFYSQLISSLPNDERLRGTIEERVRSEYSKKALDHEFLLLAAQPFSSSTILHPLPDVIQITFPQQPAPTATTQFSFLYNSYLRSSHSSSFHTVPHHHHSYDHFLSHRSQYRVVISLTTLPHRLPHLLPVLQSLLNQHVKPDQVYLNLPTSYRRFNSTSSPGKPLSIPHDIQRLVLNDILRIQAIPVDYGPATKLIPTLEAERDPSTIIITVDDDMIYKPTQVQLLLKAYFHFPYAAYGYAGQLIDLDLPRVRRSKSSAQMIRGKEVKRQVAVRTAWQWKV